MYAKEKRVRVTSLEPRQQTFIIHFPYTDAVRKSNVAYDLLCQISVKCKTLTHKLEDMFTIVVNKSYMYNCDTLTPKAPLTGNSNWQIFIILFIGKERLVFDCIS